jgi:hypothetical protein
VAVKNFHLPLPEKTYTDLRTEARRSQVPATSLARQAVEEWLKARRRSERKRQIAAFAAEAGGGGLDLDRDFEAAAIEFLRETNDWP